MLGPACEDLDAGRPDLSPLPIGHEVPQQRQIDEVAKAVVLTDLKLSVHAWSFWAICQRTATQGTVSGPLRPR